MARPAGFEPTTSWFVAKRSNPLSYGRKREKYYSGTPAERQAPDFQLNAGTLIFTSGDNGSNHKVAGHI